jgi:hypothetical protein
MSVITIKEAAELCSKTPKDIHVYIGRGKLIKRKDSLIDTSHPANQVFFDRYAKTEPKIEPELKSEIKTEPKKEPLIIETKPKEQKKKSKQKDGEELPFTTFTQLNDLKAEKLVEEIKQLSLKNQRLEGDLIELDLIKRATFEVITSYRATLYLASENILKNNMIDLGADNDKLTKAVSDLVALFNAGCTEAIENVKQSIDKIL